MNTLSNQETNQATVEAEVKGRYVDDRERWVFLEEVRRRDEAPIFGGKSKPITEIPAPKFKFLDWVIEPMYKNPTSKATAISGQVLGMTWNGESWEYTIWMGIEAPGDAEEKDLLLQQPERVKELIVYQHLGEWVFNDEPLGIVKEPFVKGIDIMIDRMTVLTPNAENGFRLLFSDFPFPNFRARLVWQREELGGNWYHCPQYDIEGWLCPVLFRYYDKAPKELFVRAEALY